MRKLRFVFNIVAVAVFSLAISSVAQAQATRTWVSGVGDDANPCSRTAPCKTFAGAISKTAAGGEISVLDPGGFGAVTITKSITLDGDGTLAGILASLTNGIIINAATTDKIEIRNLSINGVGNGINGIRYLTGGQVTVTNCNIQGFTGFGIEVNMSTIGSLFVRDTNFRNCTTGISIKTTGAFAVGNIDNARLDGMTNGLIADQNAFVTIRNSSVTQNATSGLQANFSTTQLNVENCIVTNNGTGVNAAVSGATIRLSRSGLFNNNIGIAIAGGATVASFQNNTLFNNGGVNPNSQLTQQ